MNNVKIGANLVARKYRNMLSTTPTACNSVWITVTDYGPHHGPSDGRPTVCIA